MANIVPYKVLLLWMLKKKVFRGAIPENL